jgi:hypothetical protein
MYETTSREDGRRRARTSGVAYDFMSSTNGWSVVSTARGGSGMTAHRGVLHPDEYVDLSSWRASRASTARWSGVRWRAHAPRSRLHASDFGRYRGDGDITCHPSDDVRGLAQTAFALRLGFIVRGTAQSLGQLVDERVGRRPRAELAPGAFSDGLNEPAASLHVRPTPGGKHDFEIRRIGVRQRLDAAGEVQSIEAKLLTDFLHLANRLRGARLGATVRREEDGELAPCPGVLDRRYDVSLNVGDVGDGADDDARDKQSRAEELSPKAPAQNRHDLGLELHLRPGRTKADSPRDVLRLAGTPGENRPGLKPAASHLIALDGVMDRADHGAARVRYPGTTRALEQLGRPRALRTDVGDDCPDADKLQKRRHDV